MDFATDFAECIFVVQLKINRKFKDFAIDFPLNIISLHVEIDCKIGHKSFNLRLISLSVPFP